MLTDEEKRGIVRTWRLVLPIADTAAELFYGRLFELRPGLRMLFKGDMESQRRKLMATLDFTVKSIDWPLSDWDATVDEQNDLFLIVLALGRRHRNLYHVTNDMYPAVGEALLWTLDQGLGEAFTPPVRKAWTKLYTLLATLMCMERAEQPASHADQSNPLPA